VDIAAPRSPRVGPAQPLIQRPATKSSPIWKFSNRASVANLITLSDAPSEGVDEPLTVHKLCSTLPAFLSEARPVKGEDAVRVEVESIAWRDGLKQN
jgi:hypothetical protein